MPDPKEPKETLDQQLDSLDFKMSTLRSAALLSDLNDSLEDLDSTLSNLPISIEGIRTKGYIFKGYLEKKAEVLKEQWQEIRPRVVDEIKRQSRTLSSETDGLERRLTALRSRPTPSGLSQVESALSRLQSKADATKANIRGMFDALSTNVRQSERQVKDIEWLLDQVDAASFRLYPQEAPIEAVRAKYLTDEKEGPEGVLYVTDQRLIFEQKEEVVVSRKLLVFTEKESVQELLLEVPIGQIEQTQESEKGILFAKKELLDLRFSTEAPVLQARFQLKADSEEWQALIGRVLSGDIDKERIVPKDEVAAEAMREVPTKCPTCGATLTEKIVRGMQSITCEYCGGVIRI